MNCFGCVQQQNWVSTIINFNYYMYIIYIISLYKYLFMEFADQQQLWIVYLRVPLELDDTERKKSRQWNHGWELKFWPRIN